MRRAEKAGLISAWRQVHAAVEAGVEKLREELRVAFERGRAVAHGFVGEEKREHRTDLPHLRGQALLFGGGDQRLAHLPAERIEAHVRVSLLQQFQRGDARGHGEGIAAERAGLVHRAERRQHIHDLCPATECAHGQAAADDFPQAGEVGLDVFQLLHAALGQAEASHHFVENEQRVIGRAHVADMLQVTGARGNEPDVADVRLDDHTGNFTRILGKGRGEGRWLVEGEHDGLLRKRLRHARTVGMAMRERARARLDQQRIGMSVVAAGKLDDLVAPREAAREPDGRHRGLGPAIAHPHFLDRRHEARDELGHFHLVGIGRAKRRAVFKRGGDGGLDHRVVVSVDGRTPGADEVDQLATIGRD